MNKSNLYILGISFVLIALFSCKNSNSQNGGEEIENNSSNETTISEIKIGDQIWMTQNLNVDKFRNGDPIQEAKTLEEWNKACRYKQPAWCYYENDPANGKKYKKLYNWYAVNPSVGAKLKQSMCGWA
jgi:hypothetical protein